MKTMLKGEIIFQWKKHPEKVDIACLIINHTDTNPKHEKLHTFSFPRDKTVMGKMLEKILLFILLMSAIL